jgi:hypothetical protein
MSEKLHNYLVEKGDYTKSYDDFSKQFASQESQDKLYNHLSESGEYTKSRQNFGTQFFAVKLGEQTTQNNVDMLFSAKENIKLDDEDVVNEAIENYFSLEELPKKFEDVYSPIDKTTRGVALEPTEQDLKEFFKEEKYNEYLAYNDPDKKTLPKNQRFQEKIKEAQKRRQKLALEDVSSGMSEEERELAALTLPEVIDDEQQEIKIGDKTYENPQKLYDSLKQRSPDKAMRFQDDY